MQATIRLKPTVSVVSMPRPHVIGSLLRLTTKKNQAQLASSMLDSVCVSKAGKILGRPAR